MLNLTAFNSRTHLTSILSSEHVMPLTWALLLAVLSGILLALPILNPAWYIAGWIGFVPLLLAVQKASLLRGYLLGGVCGFILYCCITYWIADYIHLFKGLPYRHSILWGTLFWFYCAQLPALLILAFIGLSRRGVSELLSFPLLLVLAFAFFPMLFSVQLGEGQRNFYYAIQAVDIVGVHGLDAMLALVNITVYRVIAGKKTSTTITAIVLVIIMLWFGYGAWAFHTWQQRLQTWPSVQVGFIQPNEAPVLGRYPVHQGYSQHYPPELELTEHLAQQGAQWVVWPEARYKGVLDDDAIMASYQQSVAEAQVNLVLQDMEYGDSHKNDANTGIKNTVALLNREGDLAGQHQKAKLVPFGEYTPLLDSAPWVAELFKIFFGEFTREIIPGKGHQSFHADGLSVVPLICNETMHSRFVAQAVGDSPKHLLLGMSSNGWFGNTLQPYQHANTSVLRAVENRLTFLHVLNNGPSLAVLPTGENLFQADYGVAGGYLLAAPYPSAGNTTVYSRYPNGFMFTVYLLSGLMLVWSLWRPNVNPQ